MKQDGIVGYGGTLGSYSEEAAASYFKDKNVILKNYEMFEDVFEAIRNKEIDYGVLPLENSSTGEVLENYDLIKQYDLYIVGEQTVKVEHHLLGLPGSTIEGLKTVYSHPQGLAQCKEFLKANPHIIKKPYVNTALAAQYIAETKDVTKGCIASKRAAMHFGLDILKPHINFNNNNFTRFVIISRNLEISKEADKLSLVFTTPHESGSLYHALAYFALGNINLLKIYSRPMQEKTWHYYFFVDLEGNINDRNVELALEQVKEKSEYFKVIGNYKADNLKLQ